MVADWIILFLDLQDLDKFGLREWQENNHITGIIMVCAHAPNSTPAHGCFGGGFFFLVYDTPPISSIAGRSVLLPGLLLRCLCFPKRAPSYVSLSTSSSCHAHSLNPQRHGGDGKEVKEESTQSLFSQERKRRNKERNAQEDGREADASESERARKDAEEAARAAHKNTTENDE